MRLVSDFSNSTVSEFNGVMGAIKICPGDAKRGTLKFSTSIADIHSYWHVFLPSTGDRIPWVLETSFAAQRGMPFVTFFNMAGINKLSVGLVDCDCDSKFYGGMNQETGCYDIIWEISSDRKIEDFSLWFDTAARPWQEEIPLWRDQLNGIRCEYPASVWDPVFCTWYAVHGAMTQEWCNKTAAKAADMGFKTFILDDGWCYPDMKRVSPSLIGTWYEKIGDWQVDTGKFPDFKGHVEYIQSLGMKYLLWTAPYLIGCKSAMYEKLKALPGATFGDYLEGYIKLDPGCREAADKMLDRLENLMKEYALDGLKVDFLDQIFPDLDAPKAGSCYNFTAELSRRIRNCNPDAMIEFRQNYAVPRMLACGTQFRAGDAPFDFMLNLRRTAQIRLALGNGVPVHADPAYWPADELPVNISRHFIAMMAAVPMLSVDLATLSPETEAICRFWISFYNKHAQWLKLASWNFDYSGGVLGSVSGETDKQDMIIVADPLKLPPVKRPSWILNMSYAPLSVPNAQVFDWNGNTIGGNVIPEGCGAFVTP